MKKDNVNYVMVGLFVLTGFVLLFVLLLKITGEQSGSDEYFVEFSNVSGIKDGVVVSYGGYAIGTVNHVEPVIEGGQTHYRLALWVKPGWRIPVDSRARIVMPALISDKQIEITQGQSTQSLQPGDLIPGTESVDMMALIDSLALKLSTFIPESTQNINQLISQLQYSADQLALLLRPQNINHLNSFIQNADLTSQNTLQLTEGLSQVNRQLDSILGKTDQLLDENAGDVRHAVLELKKSMDAISGRIDSVMYHLDASSQNMNEFSRTLRNNPGALLRNTPPADQHSAE